MVHLAGIEAISGIRVRDAYAKRADEYIEAVGSMDRVDRNDRELVPGTAELAAGPILDAGCGPGHRADFLHEHVPRSWAWILRRPLNVGRILREFARCLKPGGYLVVESFHGPRIETFDHRAVRAYRWPLPGLHRELEAAGFAAHEALTRSDPNHRPHGAILARRNFGHK